jgi:hypothetical protein
MSHKLLHTVNLFESFTASGIQGLMRWLIFLTGVPIRKLMEVSEVQHWVPLFYWGRLVEGRGFEPPTSALRTPRSPN